MIDAHGMQEWWCTRSEQNGVCIVRPRPCLVFFVFFAGLTFGVRAQHVCIIGGGIAGASTAYYAANWSRVTVFEAAPVLGGRVASAELGSGISPEAGASILAAENKLFGHFVDILHLERADPSHGRNSSGRYSMGIWDGESFRLKLGQSPVWDPLRLVMRYRQSLLWMRRYVSGLLQNFDKLYNNADHGYTSVEDLLGRAPGLYRLTQSTFASIADEKFGGPSLIREFVSAITRVNYGQDVESMNGFSGAVAIAGSGGGLWKVKGGNQQVVAGLIDRSKAKVMLNSRVTQISVKDDISGRPRYGLFVRNAESGADVEHEDVCDAVVIATPLEMADITLDSALAVPSAWQVGRKYQRTVTTFIKGNVRGSFFGENDDEDVPEMVLTCDHAESSFTSLVRISSAKNGDYFKIFSRELMSSKALSDLFYDGVEVLSTYDWLAYPAFSPPEKFARFDLGAEGHAVFYTSPIESAASALEMSSLSGRNAAALARRELGLSGNSAEKGEMSAFDEESNEMDEL